MAFPIQQHRREEQTNTIVGSTMDQPPLSFYVLPQKEHFIFNNVIVQNVFLISSSSAIRKRFRDLPKQNYI
jgi:hypothetical protein